MSGFSVPRTRSSTSVKVSSLVFPPFALEQPADDHRYVDIFDGADDCLVGNAFQEVLREISIAPGTLVFPVALCLS